MNAQTKNNRGFTIIEVVLVLAIAALIMLMVFVAWPALQRNQRDTQRRNDVSRVMSQLEQYKTNNNGNYPTSSSGGLGTFVTDYLKNEFKDPKTGNAYPSINTIPANADAGTYTYARGYKCNGELFTSAPGNGNVAVRMKLETSGVFCQDNQ